MSGGPLPGLEGLVVVDLSGDLAGAYCTKLLGDAGAAVTKVELAGGHPLRRWSFSGSLGTDGEADGALFRFLAANQRSVVLPEPATAAGVTDGPLAALLAGADVAVVSTFSDRGALGDLDPRTLSEAHPGLVVVSLSSFGLEGPRGGEESPELLVQALAGSLHNHGRKERVPLAVGGQVAGWSVGVYGALGALTALSERRRSGRAGLVDVSALECLAVTFICYPSVAAALPGGVKQRNTYVMIPGIEPTSDGWVGMATITTAQWHTFLEMIGRPDLIDDPELFNQHNRDRADVLQAINEWTTARTTDEIVELGSLYRIPTVPLGNGEVFPRIEHVAARRLYEDNPRGGFPHPRPPFRSSVTERRGPGAAPTLEERIPLAEAVTPAPPDRPFPVPDGSGATDDGRLPLEGIRVLDFTAFLAGPMSTQYLSTAGADVIKVESVQRPDPMRFTVMVDPSVDLWYEQGAIFHSCNLNKRSVTLNLSEPQGRELALRLAAGADVVIENYTPRVMEQFGLTYEDLRAVKPDLIMVRMPGFGLEGPWRDRPGFAASMEQISGLAWMTGYEDGIPQIPGVCDPLAGMHSAFAILTALEHRRRTGQGQQIELAMIDMASNLAVEQVLERTVYGRLLVKLGNRHPAVPHQGVYTCDEPDQWVALAVTSAEEWRGLATALGRPAWWRPELLEELGHDDDALSLVETELGRWLATLSQKDALAALRSAGVPCEPVIAAYDVDLDDQMNARQFWEEVDHPVVGTVRFPGWPMRISNRAVPWFRAPAPLLGQHTAEVLAELGVDEGRLEELAAAGIVGTRPLGL